MAAFPTLRIALALLWWSPALHWISRRIDEEREVACDEAAVDRTGDAKESVADGLAVREGSPLASMLGLKPGDRVAQANGIALAGIDDILVAFVKPLIASQPVHVAGIRDGKPAASTARRP